MTVLARKIYTKPYQSLGWLAGLSMAMVVTLTLSACGGGLDNPDQKPEVVPADYAQAAGPNFNVQGGATAPLNCQGPDGSAYQWIVESNGSLPIELSSYNTAQTSFTAPVVSTATTIGLVCRMTGKGALIISSRVAVTINPTAAESLALMANITGNKTVLPGDRLALAANGAWYDSKAVATPGPVINYAWVLGAGAPSGTILTPMTGSANVEVIVPKGIAKPVFFPVTVTATSGQQTSTSAITVLVDPGANLSLTLTPPAQTVQSGATVTLSTTSSGNLYYQWAIASGPNATLGGANSNSVGFIAPSVTQTTFMDVRVAIGYVPISAADPGVYFLDGVVAVTPPPATSTVTPTLSPVAQTVHSGSIVNVAVSGGSNLYYQWTVTSGPSVTLGGATNSTVGFVAPVVVANTTMTLKVAIGSSPITPSNPGSTFLDAVVVVTP